MPSLSLSNLSFRIPLSANFLTALLVLLLLVWIIHAIIIRYHWNAYGNDKLKQVRMGIYYFVGSVILFATLSFFLVAYSLSINSL